jgi:hypothetical protein
MDIPIPLSYTTVVLQYLQFYYYYKVNTSAGGLLVPDGIIHSVVCVSVLTLFIRYTNIFIMENNNSLIIFNNKVLLAQS